MVAEEPMLQIDARLAFYFKEDPSAWDDDKWALRNAQLKYIFKTDYKPNGFGN